MEKANLFVSYTSNFSQNSRIQCKLHKAGSPKQTISCYRIARSYELINTWYLQRETLKVKSYFGCLVSEVISALLHTSALQDMLYVYVMRMDSN